MKIVLAIFTICFVANAELINTSIESKSKNFSISTFGDMGSRVYYSCDVVEWSVEELMNELGAQNVSVQCSGGFNPWGGVSSPAFVRLSADVMELSSDGPMRGEFKNIEFRSSNNCHLYREIIRNTKDLFEIKDLNFSGSCNPRFDDFRLKARVLN